MSDALLVSEGPWVVQKPFKYAGDELRKGDEWEPIGGPYDELIVNQGFVRLAKAQDARNMKIARSQKRKERTNGTQKSSEVVEDRDARAYRLYHDEDMTMEQVGDELGIAASTVSRAIKRHEERLETA